MMGKREADRWLSRMLSVPVMNQPCDWVVLKTGNVEQDTAQGFKSTGFRSMGPKPATQSGWRSACAMASAQHKLSISILGTAHALPLQSNLTAISKCEPAVTTYGTHCS